MSSSQQTQNIYITFVQRRPSVFDVAPILYKCYTNVLCLLGSHLKAWLLPKYLRWEAVICQLLPKMNTWY